MAETKHILILANSIWDGNRCVAGKVANPGGGGRFEVAHEWIRLTDPNHPEGAVSGSHVICAGRGSIRPLDVISVQLDEHCANPDHPEDWRFDPSQRWRYVATIDKTALEPIADTPEKLWSDGTRSNSVSAGYVAQMSRPATLYLIKAPDGWQFEYWKEWDSYKQKDATKRRLSFSYAGQYHELSVTDSAFTSRHNIYNRATTLRQVLEVSNPRNVFFCVSLTKPLSQKHYKIGATIFEP